MKAIINKDLIIGLAQGDIEGIVISENLQNISLDKLRFDGQKIVDASTYTTFYIDENGIKHIVQHEPSWQELQCNFDDELINENGVWRVKNIDDYKQENIEELQRLEKERLQKVLTEQGYMSLADVVFYANQGDAETQQILNWYSNNNATGYDDLIWNWIENTLPTYQNIDELLDLDLKQIEEDIFNQSIQNNPLP